MCGCDRSIKTRAHIRANTEPINQPLIDNFIDDSTVKQRWCFVCSRARLQMRVRREPANRLAGTITTIASMAYQINAMASRYRLVER